MNKTRPYGIIYKIKNESTNKIYIGQTTQIAKYRWSDHKRDLKNNSHRNKHLQSSYNKYGLQSFNFSVIDTANSQEELDNKEDKWIINYNSIDEGYNLKHGGANGKMSNEIKKLKSKQTTNLMKNINLRKRISKTLTGRKLSKNHKINITDGLKEKWQLDEKYKNNVTNGLKKCWTKNKKNHVSQISIDNWKCATFRNKTLSALRKKIQKSVLVIDRFGNKKTFKSFREVEKIFHISHLWHYIQSTIRHNELQRGRFKGWKFIESDSTIFYNDILIVPDSYSTLPITIYDLDNIVILSCSSQQRAARILKLKSVSSITNYILLTEKYGKVINGQFSNYKFIEKFEGEINNIKLLNIIEKNKKSTIAKNNLSKAKRPRGYPILYNFENAPHKIDNLNQFCKDNNLSYPVIHKVISGQQSQHRGWHI